MYTFSPLLTIIALQLISGFMTVYAGKNHFLSAINKSYCPFIETLSFGSDIDIKCNSTYLIFNEINSETVNWKFANQTSDCNQNGSQQASTNQCGVSRIDSNYLKVQLESSEHSEKACVYCRINYQPIAPLITAVQSDEGRHILYIFNITATGLAIGESFEILWAKRVSDEIRHSYNYWFSQKCIDSIVHILEDTDRTIIFAVDDVSIDRVEFIIRRCNGICRKYDRCPEQIFNKAIDSNYFQTPDAIEKISCDYDCLNSFMTTPIIHVPFITSTTTKPSPEPSQRMTLMILFITVGLLSLIALVAIIFYKQCRVKGKKHVYAKTSKTDPDEHR